MAGCWELVGARGSAIPWRLGAPTIAFTAGPTEQLLGLQAADGDDRPPLDIVGLAEGEGSDSASNSIQHLHPIR